MDRRAFIGTLTGSLFAAPLAGEAQQAGKVYRIGLLDVSAPDRARLNWWEAFQQRMGELGYVAGRTVVFERRWARGDTGRLPAFARELVDLQVDVIVTASAPAAVAAKAATSTVPIVAALVADPVKLTLVAGFARPGGNITDMTSISTDLNGKRLALVKEVVPHVSRVAILWDMANPGSELAMRDVEASAPSLGVALQNLGVRRPDELESAFIAMTRRHAGAVVLIPSPRFFPERRRLSELSLKDRLPMVAGSSEYAEAGGLMSYGTHYPDLFRHAAEYVDKILKGAKPGDLPVEQPTKFELVINLKTAKALGLTIPPALLQRADQVIE